MTDEPEVLPLPPAQSSTPIRLPEPAAAQDMAAEPAPATPTGGAEESKHCEEKQPEEKMKTDTQMDDVEEERESTSTLEAGETSDSTSPCSLFRRLYAILLRMHREDLLSHQSMPTPQVAGDEKVLADNWSAANRPSSPAF